MLCNTYCPANDSTHPHGIASSGFGTTVNIKGKTFRISGGTQKGKNLFHSFDTFNLHSNEIAIFEDYRPQHPIENTISRVTGNSYSWINGSIQSSASHFYLINPNGVMFGPEAQLDLSGSFHVCTADYVKFDDNNMLHADILQSSTLTVESPKAFGFITNNPSPISIEGKGEVTLENVGNHPTGLVVEKGQTISIIGGEITINKGSYAKTSINDDAQSLQIEELGSLSAPQGSIQLISMNEAVEINLNADMTDIALKSGIITILEHSFIDVSGDSPGHIRLYAENILVKDSTLQANTLGADKNSGIIHLMAKNISLINGSQIKINNDGSGAGSQLKIEALNHITFSGEDELFHSSGIESISVNQNEGGNCADILLTAENIRFFDGACIYSKTGGSGKGSNITLEASETIQFAKSNSKGDVSGIILETHDKSENAGNLGDLTLDGKNLLFENGSRIFSLVYGQGNGGKIHLEADEQIIFSGNNIDPLESFVIKSLFASTLEKNPGGIYAINMSFSNGGNGSDLRFKTEKLSLFDAAMMLSCNFGGGNSGNINIIAEKEITLEGALAAGQWIATIGTTSLPIGPVIGGNAGNIDIQAGDIFILEGAIGSGSYNTYGKQAGDAGNISLKSTGTIKISGVNPYGSIEEFNGGSIGVDAGFRNGSIGNAGNIFIDANALIIENGGRIAAGVHSDNSGGSINITTRDFVKISGNASKYHLEADKKQHRSSSIISSSDSLDQFSGPGGNITIKTRKLMVDDTAYISSQTDGGGDAGNIEFNVDNFVLDNNSAILSSSSSKSHGGFAGTITINAKESISVLNNSEISTEAANTVKETINDERLNGKISLFASHNIFLFNSEISSNVKGGSVNGGDIHLYQPKFIVMNKSKITANAHEGNGGNIHIDSEQFIKSSDSVITASSALGVDGKIYVESPGTDINAGLVRLDDSFLDASKWVQTPCAYRTGDTVSQFIISNLDASPIDYMDSWLLFDEKVERKKSFHLADDHSVKAYFDLYFDFFSVD
jgi:filamentous hemagglutinin family protein